MIKTIFISIFYAFTIVPSFQMGSIAFESNPMRSVDVVAHQFKSNKSVFFAKEINDKMLYQFQFQASYFSHLLTSIND